VGEIALNLAQGFASPT